MKRDGESIFEDLLNLNADEWNTLLAKELNLSLNQIKELILSRELKLDEPKPKIDISKSKIKNHITKGSTEVIDSAHLLNNYVITFEPNEELITSIACTGKIIVGLDFSKAQLIDSYFCHCIFYNCKFSNANLNGAVLNFCTFNSCDFEKADFTSSTISRNRFIECNLKNTTFEYIVMSDCIVIASKLNNSIFNQSKILYSGFNDCDARETQWKDVDVVQSSFTNVNMHSSNFKRAKIIDSILIRSIFLNCDFNMFVVSAITTADCTYDEKNAEFFNMTHLVYNPSIFEWEKKKK